MSQSPKYPKIVVTPPGPKAREVVKEDQSLISHSLVRFYPLVAESGQGCIVKDVDGNEFIDFNSGLVCLAVGHSHPRLSRRSRPRRRSLPITRTLISTMKKWSRFRRSLSR